MEFKYTKEVEDALLYTFKNKDLLLQAFLTPRYAKEHNLKSYNHLKVIGESIISFLFMKCLDKNFGSYDPNNNFYELKHFNNIEDIYNQEKQMINDDMLCDLIKVFNLDKYINNGDITTGENNKETNVDIFKSILGAVILDSNYDLEAIEKVFSSLCYLDGDFING